jgi:hypothetical protein
MLGRAASGLIGSNNATLEFDRFIGIFDGARIFEKKNKLFEMMAWPNLVPFYFFCTITPW